MRLTSSVSSGVSAVERDVEHVCTLSRVLPTGACSPRLPACPDVTSVSTLCFLALSSLPSSAR
eukprot:3561116-Pleurochrysis_carterae.AAC.1